MEAYRDMTGLTDSHLQPESQREVCSHSWSVGNALDKRPSSRLYRPVPVRLVNYSRNYLPFGVHMLSTFPYSCYPMQEEPLDLSLKPAPPDEPLDLTLNKSSTDNLQRPGLSSMKITRRPLCQITSSSKPDMSAIDRTANMCIVSSDKNSSLSDLPQQQTFHHNQEVPVSIQSSAGSNVHKEKMNHVEDHQSPKSFSGSKYFHTRLSLKRPQSVHLKDKSQVGSTVRKSLPLRECSDPPRRTQRQVGLKRHVCPVCNKSFSFKSGLSAHSLVHSGLKPHSCKQCGKSFTIKSNLSVHMLVHSRLKAHSCKDCGKSFAQKSNLSIHKLTHSRLKPHFCKECGKSFAQKSTLTKHTLIHSGLKAHSCKECHKSFAHKSNLSQHMLTHSGLKPHSCKECGKSFAHKSNLSNHMLTHSGLKPHSCKECGKSFARKSTLSEHTLTHSGLKPHSCKECGKSFARASAILRHMLSHSGLKSRSSK